MTTACSQILLRRLWAACSTTTTEAPILEALVRNGMHKGPALALLLAGPALSLPSILVIRSVVGNAKTAVFITLFLTGDLHASSITDELLFTGTEEQKVIMATLAGIAFGTLYPTSAAATTHVATPLQP